MIAGDVTPPFDANVIAVAFWTCDPPDEVVKFVPEAVTATRAYPVYVVSPAVAPVDAAFSVDVQSAMYRVPGKL